MKKEKKKYGGYRNLHIEKSDLLRHREWRGFKDTMYDYYRWLVTWKDMIKMVLGDPVAIVRGLWRYRWMSSYLSIPHFIDGFTEGRRGAALRVTHLHYNTIVKNASGLILREFAADERFRPGNKRSKKSFAWTNSSPFSLWRVSPTLKSCPCKRCPYSFRVWSISKSCRRTSTPSKTTAYPQTYVRFRAQRQASQSRTISRRSVAA